MPNVPTDEDRAFLRAVLNNPAELTTWLVYADWLDEYSDPRADFIRLEIQREQLPETDTARLAIRARLEQIRLTLDPDWVAVFDRPAVENCSSAFDYRCPRLWELLQGTDRLDVRQCDVCQKCVYFCHDIEAAREHVKLGECVAIRSGLPRTAIDLMDPVEAEAWESLLSDPCMKTHPDVPN